MKIKFKKQAYQTDAVMSVVDCFKGQMKSGRIQYRVDPGKVEAKKGQQTTADYEEEAAGFKNSDFSITKQQILENIQEVQRNQNLPISDKLITTSVCDINLDPQ